MRSRSPYPAFSNSGRTTESSRRSRSEAGDTLIEVLLALIVLGLASVALLIAFSTSIAASAEHRQLATYNTVLATASQEVTAAIQNQPALFQDACAAGTLSSYPGYGTSISLPAPYNTSQYTVKYATVNPVQYWNGSVFQPTCYANAPQLITIEIAGYTNSFVVDYSVGSAASTASTGIADRLVFLNDIVGGYAGSPFTTQPIVAVETSTGIIVTTDLSPVILTLTSGSGTLSGCSGHEILGVVTFTDCTIGSGGTNFQITASDGIPTTLTTGISNVFSVSTSSFHLVFTTQPVAGTSGSVFATAPVVSVENGQTPPGVDTSWNGTISVTLSGGVLSNCPAGVATSATSATLTVMNGAATLPSSCTFSGGFFYNSNSSPPTTATQYTMSATANPAASTDSAVPTQSQTFAVTGPGAASQLKFTTEPTGVASTNASAAFTVQPAVTVEDSFGNVVYTANNSVCVQLFLGSSSQSSSVCSTSGSNGVYTFSGIHGGVWGSGYYLMATSSGLKSDQSGNFDITNVAANLAFTVSPVAGASGTAFNVQPVLVVKDNAGLVVTSATASISNFAVSPAGGVLANCTGLAPTLGYYNLGNCTFAGIVNTNYTLTVAAGGLTSSPSAGFTPSGPGVATQLVFTVEPVAGASESVLSTQPVVKVEDSAGNVVTYSTATISLTSSGGTLSSCTGLTAAAGVVNLSNCTFAGVVGTHYHLIATWGLITATSTDIWPTGPGKPSQIVLSGCSASIVSLTTCAATATIEDVYANVETLDNSSVVTFAQTSGSGSVTGLGPVTVTGGVANITLTGSIRGPATVVASSGSLSSNPLVITVNAATSVTVTSSANPSVVGQPVTYTATVAVTAPNSGTPTGQVEFFDGATPISACGGATGASVNGTSQATCIVAFGSTSSHTITAQYLGNLASYYLSSPLSSALSQVVNPAPTTVTVSSNANPSVVGQKVTYTAAVAVTAPGAGTLSSADSVTFTDNGSNLACGTGSTAFNGTTATCVVSYNSTSSHAIIATFGGDVNFTTATSSALAQVVNQSATTVTVSSNANPSVVGQKVTYTAAVAVTAPGAGTLSSADSVTFTDNGSNLACGTGSTAFNGTTATCIIAFASTSGPNSITATFGGDVNFTTSTSSALSQIVNRAVTTTSVSSGSNPSLLGQSVTFTAAVAVTAPGAGTPSSSDSVTFKDNGNILTCGSGSIAFNGTTATCTVTYASTTGTHSVTATFGGDVNFTTSTSSSLSQKVNAATTTSLTPATSPSVVVGQSVTYTAAVAVTAPGTGVPTGNVEFFDGATPISACGGAAGISLSGSAQATCTAGFSQVGTHTITAQYLGNAASYYGASPASASVNQSVTAAATTVSVSSSYNPSVLTTAVTYTATVAVTAPGAGTPSSSDGVTFTDNGSNLACGSGSSVFNGVAATCVVSYNSTGTHSISASFGGDVNFIASTSSAISQVVDMATTTVLTSSANPSPVGQSVTFTATVAAVSPGTGNPTGNVEFLDYYGGVTSAISGCGGSIGSVLSGTSPDIATCTVTYGSAGTHSITAIYLGNAATYNAFSGSSALSEVIGSTSGSYSGDSGSNKIGYSGSAGELYNINATTPTPLPFQNSFMSVTPVTSNLFTPGVNETLTTFKFTINSKSPSDQTGTVGLVTPSGQWSATALTCTVPGSSNSQNNLTCSSAASVTVPAGYSLDVRGVGNGYHTAIWKTTWTQP
jgi:type II secretory pathway pseudopilin PulG